MDKVVVDSSVWIDYFNKKPSAKTEWINSSIINQQVESSIYVLPIILQEILQGVKEKSMFNFVKENLKGFNYLMYESYEMTVKAASLFFDLRKKGVTIRKSNDVLIATICIQYELQLLHSNKDFENIAKHTSLKVYKP